MQAPKDEEISTDTDHKKHPIDWRLIADFLLKVVIPAVTIIFLVNLAFNSGQSKDPKQALNNTIMAGNNHSAYKKLKELIEQDFYNLKYHRMLLHCQKAISTHKNPIDILPTYNGYTQSNDPNTVDIGYYGLGYYHSIRQEYKQALPFFEKVNNRQMVYLNNSIGYCYLQTDDSQKAAEYFHREIEIDGNLSGAYHNLCRLYFQQRDFDALDTLLQNEQSKDYVPYGLRRYILLHQGHVLSYVRETMRMDYITVAGFIGALAILVVWFFYLRKLDTFEPEPIRFLALTLFMGMAFSLLCDFMYDYIHYGLGYQGHRSIITDLIYCVAGIGLIEETVKIVPFLLMLRFSKQINESIDYVVYPAVSALGFAFMENLMKFGWNQVSSIAGRHLTAAIMHMALTSLAAYGLFYAKYRKQNQHRFFYFSLSFIAACVVHGLYDYWLIFPKDSEFKMLSVLILVYVAIMFGNMIRNALNQSEYLKIAKTRIKGLTRYLVYSISYIFLVQYVLLGWKYGTSTANQNLSKIGGFGLLLIIYLALGVIHIERGKWVGLLESKKRKQKKHRNNHPSEHNLRC